ncbi:MAG TPA: hypothetical protein VFQ92_04055 [Blastocatellia bacterium]|nr:hypothetical protein [Blastocatellia bacterium]
MASLPEQFQDLGPFAAMWSLATESERNRRRRASTMEQLQAFYDAVLPRMDSIITYLNQYSLDDMPEDARRLFYIALSFMEVSPAVELLHEPDEAGVFEAERFKIVEA